MPHARFFVLVGDGRKRPAITHFGVPGGNTGLLKMMFLSLPSVKLIMTHVERHKGEAMTAPLVPR